MDTELEGLRVLADLVLARLASVTSGVEAALAQVDTAFETVAARVPRGEAVPLDELVALSRRMNEAERALPFELRALPTKYVPGVVRPRKWSEVVERFENRLEALHYDVLVARNPGSCDCLALVALKTNARRPSSTRLRSIGWDYDGYHNADAFACDACGTRWWHGTEDTESQHIDWWEPRPSSWEPEKPPS